MSTVPLEGVSPIAAEVREIEGRSPLRLAFARLRRDRVAMVSAAAILVLVVVALAAPLIAHLVGHDPTTQYRDTGLTPAGLPVGPSRLFLFGTDNLGRDVFIRVVYGTRISLLVGVLSTLIAIALGVVIGVTAGYFQGATDTILARFMDVVLSFPFLLFAIALVSVAGPSITVSVLVIAFFSWAAVGRIVRGQTLSIREREYVEAARSLGASDLRIMVVDVLPNLVAPVIVYTTLLIPTAIVFEATLSFLGLGVPIPTPTWGNMIAESQGTYLQAWWFLVFPSVALFITTLAFNLLGDGLRDALDPRAARVLARK
jgi:peptide/nickel transport system permease protein